MEPGHCRITGAIFPFMDINTRRPSRHLCAAAIPKSRALYQSEGTAMKKLLVAGLVAGAFVSVEARAEDRAGDAALGAVSGAVVLGPVGAVAGAVIGYTAGPSIARSWGFGRSASRSHARRTTRLAKSDPRSLKQNSNIQGDATQNASIQGTGEQAAVKVSSPPPVKSPETPTGQGPTPPVQGFE
jgi:hypothetical protein